MIKKNKKPDDDIGKIFSKLGQLLEGQKKLLIVTHNNPDPDAIASAFALRYLAEKQYNVTANIAYGGLISRAENRAMVQQLKIPLKNINRIRYSSYNLIALIDTQHGAGNNSLPSEVESHIVIDHHPRIRGLKPKFAMINPEIGATATMLVELLEISGLSIPADLATALSYAIRSETQDLGRETSPRDIKAYFAVYQKASMRKLARISNPKLPHYYFVMLVKTLTRTMVFRHLICAHIGNVPVPEIVSEMADMLLRHKRMGWSFCTGRFKNSLILSMRSSNPKAKLGKIIKHLVPDKNSAGGHDMFAGGQILIKDLSVKEKSNLETKLSQQFARAMGYANADWNPLINESEP